MIGSQAITGRRVRTLVAAAAAAVTASWHAATLRAESGLEAAMQVVRP